MKENNQQQLWDTQHSVRGSQGHEGTILRDTPNMSAITFETYLPANSNILEIGCANGRDARYWARRGHRVIGCDFSRVALVQMMDAAADARLSHKITPIKHDITDGQLPHCATPFNAFYARSALHITDTALETLAGEINQKSERKVFIMIEGKNRADPKMERSIDIGGGLYADPRENGHVRRLWSATSMEQLADRNGWGVVEILYRADQASFVRMIATKL